MRPREQLARTKRGRSRVAARLASPLCLSAALAYAFDTVWAAAPDIQYAPQSGVRIERQPQKGILTPRPPAPEPAAKPKPASQTRPLQPVPPARPAHPAARPASAKNEQTHAPSEAGLRLKLTFWLPALPGPARPAETAAAAPSAAAPSTRPPEPAASPAEPNKTGEVAAQPAWLHALLDALQVDEQGKPQPQLPEQIAQHASALQARGDAALDTRLGWALYRAQQFAQAAVWFAHALRLDPASASARKGAFYALQQSGQLQSAFTVAEGDADLRGARADLAVQLALRAREHNQPARAVDWLRQAMALGKDSPGVQKLYAWSLLQSGQPAQAAAEFSSLYRAQPDDAEIAQGLAQSLTASGQAARLDSLAAQPGALADLLRRQRAQRWLNLGLARDAAELDPLAAEGWTGAAAPSVTIGASARSKSGTPGTSQLRLTQTPVLTLRWTNHLGVWDAQLESARLDAGAAPPVGQVGSTLPGSLGSPAQQNVGMSGALHWRSLGPRGPFASLGITPTRGAVSPTWTGRVGWRDQGADHALSIALARQPVTDSVLSLTGLRDAASGQAWGRVLGEGLSIGGYRTLWPTWNASAQLQLEQLEGQNVASNDRLAASLGISRDLPVPEMRFFSLGPVVSYDHYRRNLSGFTWGQGGYFSPQDFASAGLLAVFQTEAARRWIAAGQIQLGWQTVQQDASDCFPLPPPGSAPVCAPLAASRSHGLGSSTALQWSALLSPHWALEGSALLRTGPA